MDRKHFLTKLVLLAEMCSKTLSADLIAVYDQNLAGLGYAKLCAALDELMLSRRDRDGFPAIRTIRETAQPAVSPEHEAIEASNRIVEAISKIGYARETEAEEFIGPLGWMIVQREGGWVSLCERVQMDELPTLKAQWRELAKALQGRALAGRLYDPPALPLPQSMQDEIKRLADKTGIRSLTTIDD